MKTKTEKGFPENSNKLEALCFIRISSYVCGNGDREIERKDDKVIKNGLGRTETMGKETVQLC